MTESVRGPAPPPNLMPWGATETWTSSAAVVATKSGQRVHSSHALTTQCSRIRAPTSRRARSVTHPPWLAKEGTECRMTGGQATGDQGIASGAGRAGTTGGTADERHVCATARDGGNAPPHLCKPLLNVGGRGAQDGELGSFTVIDVALDGARPCLCGRPHPRPILQADSALNWPGKVLDRPCHLR